ncbi:uncharacterized protein LOC135694291, partial [Rhopilema esculentum]|uniref:uncharacterized protein LOC135694291 n=1 Tax=Rhopilema esculentum TaxID=499914 RepID=UPI0031D54055
MTYEMAYDWANAISNNGLKEIVRNEWAASPRGTSLPSILLFYHSEQFKDLTTCNEISEIKDLLDFMRQEKIWPNGLRYLWTDAHGLCNLLTLYYASGDSAYLIEAEQLVTDVYKVLGRKKGIRIGEEPDRDGQYFHYLTKWIYALGELGKLKPEYHEKAVKLAKDIHPHFFVKGRGVVWKMLEDLSGPYPGYGFGGLDFYDGYIVYKTLDQAALSSEIADMRSLIQKDYIEFSCTQDLGLGETLWMTHHFPDEPWAQVLRQRSIQQLDKMWIPQEEGKGFFCRHPSSPRVKFAFTNYGVSVGCQAVGVWPERVEA